MAWRERQRELERLAREREEEERRKREEKVKLFLQQVPSPGGLPPSSPSPVAAPPSGETVYAQPPRQDEEGEEQVKKSSASPTRDSIEKAGTDVPCDTEGPTTTSSPSRSPAPVPSSASRWTLATPAASVDAPVPATAMDEADRDELDELRAKLAKRDEEMAMLKDAYKERLKEKEDEFKKRWEAQNKAESLERKLDEAQCQLREREQEIKRLQDQARRSESMVQSLRKGSQKLWKKRGNLSSSNSRQEAAKSKVVAIYRFDGNAAFGELSFVEGDVIEVIGKINDGWWEGRLPSGESGSFPFNYTQPLATGGDGGSAEEEEEEPANPKTLEKVAYAKKKIEERYKALTQKHSSDQKEGGADQSSVEYEEQGVAQEESVQGDGSYIVHEQPLDQDDEPLTEEDDAEEAQEEGVLEGCALFDFEAQEEGELHLRKGDHVIVLDFEGDSEWAYGRLHDGGEGHFPRAYVELLDPSSSS